MTDRDDVRDPRDMEEELLAVEEAKFDPDMLLITRYLDDDLSDAERAGVERRLESDRDFRELANPLLLVEKVRGPKREMSYHQLERAWLQVRQRAGLPPIPGHPVSPIQGAPDPSYEWRRRSRHLTRGKIVAIAAGILFLAIGLPLALAQYQLRFNHAHYATRGNTTLVVPLPDGSRVTLAGGSRLHFRKDMMSRPQRTVFLRGEATFDVAKSDRIFELWAAEARIRVLGTSFTVHGYGDEPVIVTVHRGAVEVRAKDEYGKMFGDSLVLTAGQRARVVVGVNPEILK